MNNEEFIKAVEKKILAASEEQNKKLLKQKIHQQRCKLWGEINDCYDSRIFEGRYKKDVRDDNPETEPLAKKYWNQGFNFCWAHLNRLRKDDLRTLDAAKQEIFDYRWRDLQKKENEE